MKVVNPLDDARKQLIIIFKDNIAYKNAYNNSTLIVNGFEDEEKGREDFEKLKLDSNLFELYMQSLLISVYLQQHYLMLVDGAEEYKENIDAFNSFDTPSEYIYSLEYEEFEDFFCLLCDFVDDGFYEKRDLIMHLNDNLKNLLRLCPLFVYDYVYYMNTYNTNEIMDNYYLNLTVEKTNTKEEDLSIKLDNALVSTVNYNVEQLKKLSENDFYNYKYVICEIIEVVYKYLKYIYNNTGALTYEEKEILNCIEKDLEGFIVSSVFNDVILECLLNNFIKYNILDDEKKTQIKLYYDVDVVTNEMLSKVLLKSQKIKGKIK